MLSNTATVGQNQAVEQGERRGVRHNLPADTVEAQHIAPRKRLSHAGKRQDLSGGTLVGQGPDRPFKALLVVPL